MTEKNVVIVGGGQAAAVCAMALREKEFAGRIIIIGDEPHAPYERPELSKKLVSGECSLETVTILDDIRAEKHGIRLLTGCAVQGIDRAARTVRTQAGEFAYDRLVLATGGRARHLEQAAATGLPVLTIRTAADAARLRQHLEPGRHVAVIGGGWLGLEVAASCRQAGLQVDVLEASARLCSRVAPPALSQALETLHTQNGVRLHCNAAIAFHPGGLVVTGNTEIRPDFLVTAIGMDANDELAASAGLATERGILVDNLFQTEDPHILAIGDCAAQRVPEGGTVRLESWQNANHSALVAACRIAGITPPTAEAPWFWSDQFGKRLQMVGDLLAADDIVERVTGPDERMGFHLRDGIVTGLWALGCVRDFAQARRWLAQQTRISAARLCDAGLPLKAALAA
ncbi:FAD-dependent oxidoreductase [Rhizobium sp. CSW-27]|nr:FAD-dependent oxidoreductase [Rhizobium sp. CSW-27]